MNIRLISWNVNGIRAAQKKGLLDYLNKEKPDIFCVQETKASPEQLGEELTSPDAYQVLYHSCSRKKGYSGVATFSNSLSIPPQSCSVGFDIEKFDEEGRVVQTNYQDFTLFNVYFPNGGMPGRVEYKLDFYQAFFDYCRKLRNQGRKLVICGDFNTAHKEIDLARPKDNEETSGFMPIEREWMDKIVSEGYIDTFRLFNQEAGWYTWWSMRTKARERNIGWRIDYFFVSEDLREQVVDAKIHPDVHGSDHCPIELVLSVN